MLIAYSNTLRAIEVVDSSTIILRSGDEGQIIRIWVKGKTGENARMVFE